MGVKTSDLIRAMQAHGVTSDQIVGVLLSLDASAEMSADISADCPRTDADDRREKDRIRKRLARSRASGHDVDASADIPRTDADMGADAASRAVISPAHDAPTRAVIPVGISNDIPPIIPPKNPPADRDAQADAFAVFWMAWPNKVGKPTAAKSFAKVWRDLPAILDGIDRYIAAKPPDRPWLNPATFLNQRRWEDAPAPVATSPPARGDALAQALANEYRRDEIEHQRQAPRDLGDVRRLASPAMVAGEAFDDGSGLSDGYGGLPF
jgi:hypothetical protein